jgi:glycosyltransferase involved in cell wall biosynthesis
MMIVFHFILDHRVGGPHVYVRSLTKALGESVASTVVTTGRGELTDISLTNLRHRLRMLYPFEVLLNVLRLLWLFRKSSARCNCIFDVHGAANLAPIIAARLLRIPIVWHFHETLGDMQRLVWFGKLFTSRVEHRKVTVAKRSMKAYQIDDAELIYAPIDTAYWRISERQRDARAENSRFRMVSVGNLNPLKGMDILLDAVAGLDIPWELVIIGAELSTFREYAKLLREKGHIAEQRCGSVRFVGWQSTESVRDLLACADVFVLASRSEAGPIALFEAMAMECACVISDVGDAREIIGNVDAGIVIDEPHSSPMLKALEKMYSLGPAGRGELGRRARERVAVISAPESVAQRHFQIYSELSQPVSKS